MKRIFFVFAVVFASYALAVLPAKAQSGDTPQQLQTMIANGQEQNALAELRTILQAHPTSGVAWYLTAEAQDAAGNEAAARSALTNAQNYAPGLPFANQSDVAALQAHLNSNPGIAPMRPRTGISPALVGIIVLVGLFILFRMFFRRRRNFVVPPGYQGGYGQGGPGPYPYNQGPGMGGPGMGIGGSILGGLAAGAGFAAGERVIDGMFGGNNNVVNPAQADPNWGNQPIPDRDDGLQGSPGWDPGSTPDDNNFDPGNNW